MTPKPTTPTQFLKVAVKRDVKREIDIIAAHEQRPVYEVISDMMEIYKATSLRAAKAIKKSQPVTVAEFITAQ